MRRESVKPQKGYVEQKTWDLNRKAASSKWVWHQFRVNSSSFYAHLCNQALMIYACCRRTVCLGRLIKVSAEPLSLAASQLVEWYVQISLEFSCRAAVIFQVFFSSAPLSCQSPTSIKHGNQPLQGRALPQTRTQTLQRPLLAKCQYFHYQLIPKIIFCFTTHSVLSNAVFFSLLCTLLHTVPPRRAPLTSLCQSLWFFLCVCSGTSPTVGSTSNQKPL